MIVSVTGISSKYQRSFSKNAFRFFIEQIKQIAVLEFASINVNDTAYSFLSQSFPFQRNLWELKIAKVFSNEYENQKQRGTVKTALTMIYEQEKSIVRRNL